MLSKNKKMNSNSFGKVHITKYNSRTEHYDCKTLSGYDKHLKTNPNMCECIGEFEQQIKPVFDVDAYDTEPDIEAIIADIQKLFPNKPVNYAKREPRECKGKLKYSLRFYVDGVRITSQNLKKLIIDNGFKNNEPFDMSIYDKNKILFLPKTTEKTDGLKVPALIPIDCDVFECCASYIKEEYEDWDIRFKEEPKQETFKEELKRVINTSFTVDNDDDGDETPDKFTKLSKYIKLLLPKRSDDFDSWIKLSWCIINICNKESISRRKAYDLVHQFSKLSKTNYNEDRVDEWLDLNFDKVKETGYGWNYLIHTCVKEDNPKFYETMSKSYYNMKKEFELNNAKILYPPMVVHKDRTGENIIQPIPLCEKTNRHIKCSVKETNKKGEDVYKDKKFIELWLDDPRIRKYDNYVFKPLPLKVEEYEYNTWTDFEITKIPFENDESIIERFLEYMKNLFNNDEVVNYILAYFANRIQNPAIRNMVCIILYGEEGDGKNRLFDTFKNIIGDKYYTELENAKQMFGAHSCIEKEKLFICVNEAKGKDNYENSETLKARITTDKLIVNPKGIQEFKIDNFCDYIMTTNNANAVNLHDKSRRYLYVETTSYYSRNSEFFNAFSNDIVDNPKALRVIYEYLMKFDIKKVIPSGNFQNHIPETEIQKDIIKNNRDKILYFLEDLINEPKYSLQFDEDDDEKELKIKNSELFTQWGSWISKNNIKCDYNNIAFHSRLGQLTKKKINLQDTIIKKDTNQNTYIKLEKLRSFFIKLNE